MKIQFGKFANELWLVFGFLKDNYQDMCWYNEGEAREFPYWLKNIFTFRSKHNPVYFIFRYRFFIITFTFKTPYLPHERNAQNLLETLHQNV